MSQCKNCRDTGKKHLSTTPSGERVHSHYLDCRECGVADERMAFAKWASGIRHVRGINDDDAWTIFQHGKQQAEPLRARIAELEREVAANREKIAAEAPQWIACSDRLPKVLPGRRTKCLMVWCDDIKCQFTASLESTEFADGSENIVWTAFSPGGGSRITGVTHWREMSPDPAAKENTHE